MSANWGRLRNLACGLQPKGDPQCDDQWLRIVGPELVLHPPLDPHEIVERDCRLQDGRHVLKVTACIVGYILQHWNVDYFPDHSLDTAQHVL